MKNKSIVLHAPAKVNYRLDVLRKRPDGYHDLRMIMQRVNLSDIIRLTINDSEAIKVTCGSRGVPDGADNIAWRAAEAILNHAPERRGIDIAITKRIPVAAGLGGGSSDAACVLTGLNDLLELNLSVDNLMKIGATLGADVPFFIFGNTAIAEGIGEQLTPVRSIPPAWLVLVNPNIHVSTAWVFQQYRLPKRAANIALPDFFGTISDVCSILGNDLEAVTISRFPVIQELKEQLIAEGACASLMSGSGPTVFGIFECEAAARKAANAIADNSDWFVTAVQTL